MDDDGGSSVDDMPLLEMTFPCGRGMIPSGEEKTEPVAKQKESQAKVETLPNGTTGTPDRLLSRAWKSGERQSAVVVAKNKKIGGGGCSSEWTNYSFVGSVGPENGDPGSRPGKMSTARKGGDLMSSEMMVSASESSTARIRC